MPIQAPKHNLSPAIAMAAAGLLVLGGCLSDGPNRVGVDYLAERGIVLQTPIHDFTFDNFPLSDFQSSLQEPSHLGDTVAMLGYSQGVTASYRAAFSLVRTEMLDSLDSGRALSFALGFPRWGEVNGNRNTASQKYLESLVANRDSMRFVITFLDIPLDDKNEYQNHVVPHFQRTFLERGLSLDLVKNMPSVGTVTLTQEDTVWLNVSGIYGNAKDTLWSIPLPHLLKRLKEKRHIYRYIMMQITPVIPDSLADSLTTMLRPAGSLVGAFRGPGLIFGDTASPFTASTEKRRLEPYSINAVGPAVSFLLSDTQPEDSTLTLAPKRNLKFQVNRQALLDSITGRLGNLSSTSSSVFDSRFFVSYADITLPYDRSQTHIDNGYAVDIQSTSTLDSLAGSRDSGFIAPILVQASPAGELTQWQNIWVLDENASAYGRKDTLSISYKKSEDDGSYRFARLRHSLDTTKDIDTLLLQVGSARETFLGGVSRITPWVRVKALDASCEVHFALRSATDKESNTFIDPTTKKQFTTSAGVAARFLNPKSTEASFTFRATESLQKTLNRISVGSTGNVSTAIGVQIAGRRGLQQDSAFAATYFPVLGKVRFPVQNGQVRAKIRILLYPLPNP